MQKLAPSSRKRLASKHLSKLVERLETRRLLAATYSLLDLTPNATGNAATEAEGVSNNGNVALSYKGHAAVYINGTLKDLGFAGQTWDINDAGTAVGEKYIGNSGVAFIYSNGTTKFLGSLSKSNSFSAARAINKNGDVVGFAFSDKLGDDEAFLYHNGVMTGLGALSGGSYSLAEGINDSGQIVGFSGNAQNRDRAFLYSGGSMKDLGALPGGVSSEAYHGINNAGLIAGDSATNSGGSNYRVFTSANGGALKNIGAPAGTTDIFAFDINSAGSIVGLADVPGEKAYAYTGGAFHILNGEIDPALKWQLTAATGINDSGKIVGYGAVNGNAHAFLLTPITNVSTDAVSGTVFNDANNNSKLDSGEAGIANVTITLTPAGGGAAKTFKTTATGAYSFTGLPTGSYTVSSTVPSGFTKTAPSEGDTFSLVFNASGQSVTNANFGFFKTPIANTASVSGRVFNDANNNGVIDNGETGLANVRIDLIQGNTVQFVDTDASGNYTLSSVAAGSYTLSQVLLNGYTQSRPSNNGSYALTISKGQVITNELFGQFKPVIPPAQTGAISGVVFNDANHNGVRDTGEAGLANVTLKLDSAAIANKVAAIAAVGSLTATTNASGAYTFSNVPVGTYSLTELLLTGYQQTKPASGGYTETVQAGKTIANQTFGQYKPVVPPPPPPPTKGTITGTVFGDTNNNGIRDDASEPTGSNRIVFLDTNGNGKLDAGEKSTKTNANGVYTFSGLAAGTYKVSRVYPRGFHMSNPSPGTGGKDVLAMVTDGVITTIDLGSHFNQQNV